jgi:hypothetical protein
MKDELLFGTIGLLVGVVVMQWTIPNGQATVVTPPVGSIVATMDERVLGVDGNVWVWSHQYGTWENHGSVPVPVADVHFIEHDNDWGTAIVDKDGNWWELFNGEWVNRGQPPAGPIPTSSATFGKVKAQYKPKGEKQ